MSQAQKLYDFVIAKKGVILNPIQEKKFLHACENAIAENATLGFNDWVISAQVYLLQILRLPDLEILPQHPLED
jgi:hypothetical protein